MIDRASITNWGVAHPWEQKSFVEQDLVISRALVSIYSDPLLSEALAFRGGTALHKLYLAPQIRYSEDIDLVQVEPSPVKPIVERLDAVLAWLPGQSFDLRRFGFRMRFRYDSELPPSVPMRLKVEVNTYEHFSELGFVKKPFTVENAWFSGSCTAWRNRTGQSAQMLRGRRILRGLLPNLRRFSFARKTPFVNLSHDFLGRIEPLRPSCLRTSGFPSRQARGSG